MNFISLAVLAAVLIGISTATYTNVKKADKEYLLKQKRIYQLLHHVSQPTIVHPEIYQEALSWNIETNIDSYTNKLAVKEFLQRYEQGMLPRGEIFSLYYPQLLEEVEALFKLFYYTKDFETFFKTAAWARVNINEGQFVYALFSAVVFHPDTLYLRLPPPYELYPNFFFNSEVIEKAHHAKFFGKLEGKTSSTGIETYIIPANYSGWYIMREDDPEQKLNYFTEDIGLNSFYVYFRQSFPFWMNGDEFGLFKTFRGEEYLYGHKQILTRYYLERLSNDLVPLEDFDWNKEFVPGYYPTITYGNGLPFSQRTAWSMIPRYKYKYLQDVRDVESRINAVIDFGYITSTDGKSLYNIYTPEGLNILGNLIEGNADSYSPSFYKSLDRLARKILGFNLESTTPYQIIPSALENLSTSMRDPAFYRLYKKIYFYYQKYKKNLKPYSRDEVIFPGMKIESVAVDKMLTYFEQFDASINNALLVESHKESMSTVVKARQYRLNHKPFNIHITINSDKATKAAIRIFLGPKYNKQLFGNFLDYYEIDQWITDLNSGVNKIERSSTDSLFLMPDQPSSDIFYQNLLKAIEGTESMTYEKRIFGFPERLLLPKGKKEGFPLQLFVYVNPLTAEPVQYKSRIWGEALFDQKPFGFPVDRPIYSFNFTGPNLYFKDVLVYHKDEINVDATI